MLLLQVRLVRRCIQKSDTKCHVGNHDKPWALNRVPEKKQKGRQSLGLEQAQVELSTS